MNFLQYLIIEFHQGVDVIVQDSIICMNAGIALNISMRNSSSRYDIFPLLFPIKSFEYISYKHSVRKAFKLLYHLYRT